MHYKRLALVSLCAALATSACQKRRPPVPMPTQDQWRRVTENLLQELPEEATATHIEFADGIVLRGWSLSPEEPIAGEEFTLDLYWEATEDVDRRWQIFVHMDGDRRENFDHEPVANSHPTSRWAAGQLLRDRVSRTFPASLGATDIKVLVGLFDDEDRSEARVVSGEATLEEDGRVLLGEVRGRIPTVALQTRRAVGEFVIDGRLTETSWRRARRSAPFVHPASGEESSPQTTAKLLWNEEALYVGINGRDDDIWASGLGRDENIWEGEVMEFYIDMGGDGLNYVELQIDPNNQVFDARFIDVDHRSGEHLSEARAWNIEGLETGAHVVGTLDDRSDTDRRWSVEARIPWTSLPDYDPAVPLKEQDIRFNFYRYERSGETELAEQAFAATGGGTFHQPSRFARAELNGGPRTERRAPSTQGE